MDSAFSLNGFIYTSLRNLVTDSKNLSPITSWPPFDGIPGSLLSQMGDQHQTCSIGSNASQPGARVENAFDPLSTSMSSAPSSSLSLSSFSSQSSTSSCHSFDYASDTTDHSHTDMLESSSSHYNSAFSQGNLSPYYNIYSNIGASRTSNSSSAACVDPASLVLNNNQGSTTGLPSCVSTPEQRRHSSFSVHAGVDSEDEQHSLMQSMFAQKISVSSPSLSSSPGAIYEPQSPMEMPTYLQDFIMPDGTVYRFDGADLVPAPSIHFSNLPTHTTVTTPVPGPTPFTSRALMDQTLPVMLPPYVSVSDYGLIAPSMPSLLSEPQKIGFGNQATGRVHKTPGAKKRALRNTVTTRRDSSDSDYMSSSSSISASKSRGGNNSGHNKYRKDGAGEHQCPFENCTYRYNLRRELNRHRNVHVYAGKDKYRCMNCNSGLCRLDSVKRHMEAKGKVECLRKGLYQEFKENGELVRVRKCKPSWYEAAAANAAAAAASATAVRSGS